MNVYDFTVKTMDGKDVAISSYKGKVLLIVNTATECGFTPQYGDLEAMYKEFREKGFEILDFPSNQFHGQAPGSDEEIHVFCTGRFGVTFEQFHKIDVNGDDAIPLYKYLTENTSFGGFSEKSELTPILEPIVREMDEKYKENGKIKWNFTKFLISRNGEIIKRFEPTDSMTKVKEAVKAAL